MDITKLHKESAKHWLALMCSLHLTPELLCCVVLKKKTVSLIEGGQIPDVIIAGVSMSLLLSYQKQ